jgi:hypothetical protein
MESPELAKHGLAEYGVSIETRPCTGSESYTCTVQFDMRFSTLSRSETRCLAPLGSFWCSWGFWCLLFVIS